MKVALVVQEGMGEGIVEKVQKEKEGVAVYEFAAGLLEEAKELAEWYDEVWVRVK